MTTPIEDLAGTSRIPRKSLSFRRYIFCLLLLAVPLPATDFLVSVGVFPVSFFVFYALLWAPLGLLTLLLYWMVIIYVVVLYGIARLLDTITPRAWQRGVIVAVALLLAAVASCPVYVPISHSRMDATHLLGLFAQECRTWWENQPAGRMRWSLCGPPRAKGTRAKGTGHL